MSFHQVRVTGVLVQEGCILIVKQRVDAERGWSLPGGRLESGETMQQAIVREMREETGLVTSVQRLLYVAEKPEDHLIHITFELRQDGGRIELPSNEFEINPISDVRFVPTDQLEQYGFSAHWRNLASGSFADAPRYVGPKSNIGLWLARHGRTIR